MSVNKVILSFNWTKVELKLDFAEASEGWDVSFNWTKVELKQNNVNCVVLHLGSFNWTKVELKQKYYSQMTLADILLIELR